MLLFLFAESHARRIANNNVIVSTHPKNKAKHQIKNYTLRDHVIQPANFKQIIPTTITKHHLISRI